MQFHGRYTRMLMSKSESRFVANRELWSALQDHVTRGKGVRAAVAYFGRNGAKLMPLKRGDTIIVDVSLGAVRQGVTDPRALRTLMRRGVAVFSRASLHAKFVIAGRTLIVSSANVSRNSREILDEAGIITTDPAALRRAANFFEKLCTEPVGKKYLAQCIKEYRPPMFKAAIEGFARQGRSKRITEAKLWFVGGLVALDLSNEEALRWFDLGRWRQEEWFCHAVRQE
jgi:phosphatidylserine/phosphatidylglycerophosphate/cardiolipin synthase-like enzyme